MAVGRPTRVGRHPLALALALALLGAGLACTDAPTGPRPSPLLLALQPELVGASQGLPIHRIVVRAQEVASGREVGSLDRAVDPAAPQWTLTLELQLTGDAPREIRLAMELFNVDGGAQTVQWSGITVLEVTPGGEQEVASVQLYPGALAPIADVRISPAGAFLRVGGALTLTGEAFDADGNPLSRLFTWSSSDALRATVSSSGVVNGLGAGAVTVIASAEGNEGTASITVYLAVPTSLAAAGGDGQTGSVGTPLPLPLLAEVLDQNGMGVAGHAVQFVVTGGGGAVVPASATTDEDGLARASWTLGPEAGPQAAEARAAGLAGSPVAFTATAVGTTVETISVEPADDTLAAGDTRPFTATARDGAGNVLEGVVLSWSSSDTLVARVDAQGRVTAGRIGTAIIRATASGKEGTATVTVVRGAPTYMYPESGDGQVARAGTALPEPLVTRISDRGGNGVAGVEVHWVVLTGGGAVSAASSITDEGGLASTEWTLGPEVGIQTAEASSAGLSGSPHVYTATATSGEGALKTWVGGDADGPTRWSNFANWSPSGVPGEEDTALIPAAAPNQPVVGVNVSVGTLVVESGATVDNGGYQITVLGDLEVSGRVIGDGQVASTGQGVGVRGELSSLVIEGTAEATGQITVDGRLAIVSGDLAVGAWRVEVTGDFDASGGTLTMDHADGRLDVGGSVGFANNDQTGKLSAGEIHAAGDFGVGCYNSTEFVPGGTRVVMDGSSPQTIAIDCGGASGSRFHDLVIAAGAAVSTASNPLHIARMLDIAGTFTVLADALVDVAGPAGSLVIRSGGTLVNHGTVRANLPISNSGTVTGNPVVQR